MCPPCRCAAVLLRLAGFCGAPRRALAKIGALRQLRLAVSAAGSARLSCPPPGDRRETAPSFIGIAAVKVTPQRKPRTGSSRFRAPRRGAPPQAAGGTAMGGGRDSIINQKTQAFWQKKTPPSFRMREKSLVLEPPAWAAAQFVPACFAHNSKREPASAK